MPSGFRFSSNRAADGDSDARKSARGLSIDIGNGFAKLIGSRLGGWEQAATRSSSNKLYISGFVKQIAGRDLRKVQLLVHHKPFNPRAPEDHWPVRLSISSYQRTRRLHLPALERSPLRQPEPRAWNRPMRMATTTLSEEIKWWNLWLALNPDATLPVNGPSDGQANIAIALHAGKTYKYYLFGGDCCFLLSHSGLNLFFDGNNSVPGISVFGVSGGLGFTPNSAAPSRCQATR